MGSNTVSSCFYCNSPIFHGGIDSVLISHLAEHFTEMRKRMDAKDIALDDVARALEKYGKHTSQCLEDAVDNHFLETPEPPCICGFDDALAALRKLRRK